MKKYPILILHGWNLNAIKYDPLITEFKKRGFEVACFDLPGFRCTTSLQSPYTIADYGIYIIDYLKKLKYKEVIVIGHSFGGRVGIYLSLNFPETVKALIITGTPGLGADLTIKEEIYLLAAKTGKKIFSIPHLSNLQDLARRVLYKFVGSYDYYKTQGVLRETFKNIIAYRLEPFLDKITQPTLIVWGEEDKIVPVKVAYGMNRLIKNSKIVIIPKSRHGVPWTNSMTFANEVERFLNVI
ncbi:hypothetical protein A2960_01145 [Candidatus Gottesmanbacteria bacterium RIFCSPLOWO2_01_FULL_39_12b]|uniref:AB hydrolase-1 domain-containing protein n=1 Tax=Candidatus Gottesmanbacteria bacterium RIFCSPLOWO2_01_FULL_39_12b TaxID=1798388 RepID=A0A1F6AQ00_9BACT|nr:MAG: hypothetical protein A2960_01145 [Candidatus Gottesmanbacteria bacterium RIFCSPLOWO2_01_FULL_39_12b]